MLVFLALVAHAEDVLDTRVGHVDASAYPKIELDLRVAWEEGFAEAPGDAGIYTLVVTEAGQPVEVTATLREHSDQVDVLHLAWTSAVPEPTVRDLHVEVDVDGFHNLDGDDHRLLGELEPNGYMVIVAGSGDAEEARAAHTAYYGAHLPRYGATPQLLQSDWVPGLNPGFHVVVPAVIADEAVAKRFVERLRPLSEGAYYRPVRVAAADALRLVVVEGLQATAEDAGLSGAVRATSHGADGKPLPRPSVSRLGDETLLLVPVEAESLALEPQPAGYTCDPVSVVLPADGDRVTASALRNTSETSSSESTWFTSALRWRTLGSLVIAGSSLRLLLSQWTTRWPASYTTSSDATAAASELQLPRRSAAVRSSGRAENGLKARMPSCYEGSVLERA